MYIKWINIIFLWLFTSTTPPAAVISLSLHEQLLFVCFDVDENIMEKFFHAFSLNIHTLIAEHQALKLIDMINFYSKFLRRKKTHAHARCLFFITRKTNRWTDVQDNKALSSPECINCCKKLRLVKSELAFQFARLICVHIFRQFHQ